MKTAADEGRSLTKAPKHQRRLGAKSQAALMLQRGGFSVARIASPCASPVRSTRVRELFISFQSRNIRALTSYRRSLREHFAHERSEAFDSFFNRCRIGARVVQTHRI